MRSFQDRDNALASCVLADSKQTGFPAMSGCPGMAGKPLARDFLCGSLSGQDICNRTTRILAHSRGCRIAPVDSLSLSRHRCRRQADSHQWRLAGIGTASWRGRNHTKGAVFCRRRWPGVSTEGEAASSLRKTRDEPSGGRIQWITESVLTTRGLHVASEDGTSSTAC